MLNSIDTTIPSSASFGASAAAKQCALRQAPFGDLSSCLSLPFQAFQQEHGLP